MSFGRGYLRDPLGHAYTLWAIVAAHFGIAAATTPDSVDLRQYCPAVMDQGTTSACTGHGTSGGVACSFAAAGSPLPFVPSPDDLYKLGRCVDRLPNPDGTLPRLTDDGAQPSQVVRGAELWGIRATRAPASDGRNSDVDPATVNAEPTLGALTSDMEWPLVGTYAIDGAQAARVAQCRQALASGVAVGCGFFADTGFENIGPGAPAYGAPNETDPNGGGHWTYLCGYLTNADGSTGFLLCNSWGTAWADAGFCWVNEAFIGACWQLIAFSVRRAA